MNAMLPLFAADAKNAKAQNILAAARAFAPHLARARTLDRKLVSNTMTLCFGGSDAEGVWSWRDAYDATEAAMVLHMRRLAPQIGRVEDAPAQIAAMLDAVQALALTHTRRSEEQLQMDQFSTTPALAALTVAAAQVRPGDHVLEPSAGTGILAVVAEACGGAIQLNELSAHRASLLEGLFSLAPRSSIDAVLLPDVNRTAGSFQACVTNPPFQFLLPHLKASLKCLADGGRMSAVVPARAFEDRDLIRALTAGGEIIAMIGFPERAFAKHGTSVATGLLIVDRRPTSTDWIGAVTSCEDLAAVAAAITALPPRSNVQARTFREVEMASLLVPRNRPAAAPSGRLALLQSVSRVEYEIVDWKGEGREVGIFQAYDLSRIAFAQARPHPSPLVEAAAMASIPLPVPTYRPVLPTKIMDDGLISDAQLETIVYAGEAHSTLLPGFWRVDPENPFNVDLTSAENPEAVQFRRGYFLGDGTGAGKGRQAASLAACAMTEGHLKAVWVSKNEALLEDARRDWTAIGGQANDIAAQSSWKQSEEIRMDKGIVFTTYATLRQPARGAHGSRLDQLVKWLGADFEGAILFDEAHAAANAAGSVGARGAKAASQQGLAVLSLQNQAPKARVTYISATGATTPENLAYAARLGLWGGPEAPFNTRAEFLAELDRGGIATMEIVSRELKASGVYCARSLSFDGVEYEPLQHDLTPDDIEIWNKWADAFVLIHSNLQKALEAIGVTEEGKAKSGMAKAAIMSAFEGNKLRFFSHLLAGLKVPTIIKRVREVLAAGESAVLQIVSTNEAVMNRRLAEIPPEEWNDVVIDLTPREYVLGYLRNAFPVARMDAIEDDKGNVTLVPAMVYGVPVVSQEALALRDELLLDMACLPAVPGVLDGLIHALGVDVVAEVTGRARRVVKKGDRFVVERRGTSANRAETNAFMDGGKRVLIFSDAGGTGRSYHADRSAGNQTKRNHLLVEPGYRADAAVQGLGRTNRTNQRQPPLFQPTTSNIRGEKRFLSTIARRLDSLGALTRGERRSASNGLFKAEDNLESPWARRALIMFYHNLLWGELKCMKREEFETKTGLNLMDGDGALKDSEDLPPMNTFLNRVLAMRIEDQNAIFIDYEQILGAVIENASASGQLDRGVEDIVCEELAVAGEQIIRTDPTTGATTSLVTFDLKTRRHVTTAEAMIEMVNGAKVDFVINGRNGHAAVVFYGETMTGDDNRLIESVRLYRPFTNQRSPLSDYAESSWETVDQAIWQAAWDSEIATSDPFSTRRLILATGILLPIWKLLPASNSLVRRVKAPDGRRWLGRVLEESDAARLLVELGISSAAEATADPVHARQMLMADGARLHLTGSRYLRRARVMDRRRIEFVGFLPSERAGLLAMGCFLEVIASTARIFVPVDQPEILAEVLRHYPVAEIASGRLAA